MSAQELLMALTKLQKISAKELFSYPPQNVTSGKIDWENVKYIDEKQHLEMHKRIAPRINDILLAKNGTTGVAAFVDRDVVFGIYVSLAHIRALDGKP